MTALVVTAQWVTDGGPMMTRRPYAEHTAVASALQDMAQELERRGKIVVRLARCYTQEAPVIAGTVCCTMAGPMQRVPESRFRVTQHVEMEGKECSDAV
ncbi:MAG: hypothetical protein ABFD60_07900 [Bryobacteraceae bacterium]